MRFAPVLISRDGAPRQAVWRGRPDTP